MHSQSTQTTSGGLPGAPHNQLERKAFENPTIACGNPRLNILMVMGMQLKMKMTGKRESPD